MNDDNDLYCRECGSERLHYVEQYANGYEYKCLDCDNVQMHLPKKEDEEISSTWDLPVPIDTQNAHVVQCVDAWLSAAGMPTYSELKATLKRLESEKCDSKSCPACPGVPIPCVNAPGPAVSLINPAYTTLMDTNRQAQAAFVELAVNKP